MVKQALSATAAFPELPWLLANRVAAGAGCSLKVGTQTALDRHVSWSGRACLVEQTLSVLLKSPLVVATALKVLPTGAGGGGTSSSLLDSLASSFLF